MSLYTYIYIRSMHAIAVDNQSFFRIFEIEKSFFFKNPLRSSLVHFHFDQVSQKLLANLRRVVPPRDLGSIVQGRGGGHGRRVHHSEGEVDSGLEGSRTPGYVAAMTNFRFPGQRRERFEFGAQGAVFGFLGFVPV